MIYMSMEKKPIPKIVLTAGENTEEGASLNADLLKTQEEALIKDLPKTPPKDQGPQLHEVPVAEW